MMDKKDIVNRIQTAMTEHEDSHPSVDIDDQAVIRKIFKELKLVDETYASFRNIEDLSQHHIRGAGAIVSKYIFSLKSQTARAGLIHHLIGNRTHRCARVKNCNELVWRLFGDLLSSDSCFDSGILNDYDHALAVLKPKEYEAELIAVSKNPCLFNNMPRTMHMLASRQCPGFRDVLLDYFMHPQRIEEYLSEHTLDKSLHMDEDRIKREIDWWQKSGKYTAISGLKYYPSEQIAAMLIQYANDTENEMKREIQKCTDQYEKAEIRYRYFSISKTLRDTIHSIEKAMTT